MLEFFSIPNKLVNIFKTYKYAMISIIFLNKPLNFLRMASLFSVKCFSIYDIRMVYNSLFNNNHRIDCSPIQQLFSFSRIQIYWKKSVISISEQLNISEVIINDRLWWCTIAYSKLNLCINFSHIQKFRDIRRYS